MENLLWLALSKGAFRKFKTRRCVRSGKKSSKRLSRNWRVLRLKSLASISLDRTWPRARWAPSTPSTKRGMLKSTKRKDRRPLRACKAGNSSSHYRTLKRCHINHSSNNLPSLRRATIDRMEVVEVEMRAQEGGRATMVASTMPRRSNSRRTSTTRLSSECHLYLPAISTPNPPYEPWNDR